MLILLLLLLASFGLQAQYEMSSEISEVLGQYAVKSPSLSAWSI